MAEYIDREKLIDETDDKYSLGDTGRMERDIIVDALLYATPADVRPVVRGRWVINNGRWCCNKCTCQAVVIRSPFCPNCGAKMEE